MAIRDLLSSFLGRPVLVEKKPIKFVRRSLPGDLWHRLRLLRVNLPEQRISTDRKWPCYTANSESVLFTPLRSQSAEERDGVGFYLLLLGDSAVFIELTGRTEWHDNAFHDLAEFVETAEYGKHSVEDLRELANSAVIACTSKARPFLFRDRPKKFSSVFKWSERTDRTSVSD